MKRFHSKASVINLTRWIKKSRKIGNTCVGMMCRFEHDWLHRTVPVLLYKLGIYSA